MSEKLLPPSQAAELLNSTTRTLKLWRRMGRGPAFHRVGGKVFYRLEGIDSFLERGRVEPKGAERCARRVRVALRPKVKGLIVWAACWGLISSTLAVWLIARLRLQAA